MHIIDISWPISSEMTAYKNKKTVQITAIKNFYSDGVRESIFSCNVHSGTHVDAPAHFLKDGKTIDAVLLSALVGSCKVLDFTRVSGAITQTDLQQYTINSGDRILLKTTNSALSATAPFEPEFVYLDKSAAQYLAGKKIAAVGIDYLGIERAQPAHETHTMLMNAGIAIIEGLRLQLVNPGNNYILYCLPIHLLQSDAAPARAILVHD